MPKFIFLYLLSFSIFSATGQNVSDHVIGKKVLIQSEELKQERELLIYLPESYNETEKKYPVLYLLDGQRWFLQAASYQRLFAEYEYMPECIVVGIKTDDSPRYGFFANSERLLNFLEQEVLSYVDDNFRTSNERILFGWQFAGAFNINVLANNPQLFNAYLAASPIPLNQQVHERLQSLATSTFLFIGTSENEDQVNAGVEGLVDFLEKGPPQSLRWEHKSLEIEPISSFGHRTSPLGVLYHGLRSYYNDYPLLEFDRLEDFTNAGGVDYVKKYYEDRGEKYGISKDIPQEGMFFLVRMGLDANHFPTFQQFMSDFIEKDFLENVNLGWGTRYAEFYLSNNDPDGAERVYEILTRRFPESARPVNGLGDVHANRGDKRKAERYYKNAIELGERNSDRRLQSYKKDLEELQAENSEKN